MICKRFHWLPHEVAALPHDFYQDLMVIMNLQGAKEEKSI